MFISLYINRFRAFSLIFILLIIIGIIFITNTGEKINKATILSQTQEKIIAKENDIDQKMIFIKDLVQSKQPTESVFSQPRIRKIESEDETFLIFENDSLVYWSNNKIPVSNKFQLNNFKTGLNTFQNGFINVRQLVADEFKMVALIPIRFNYDFDNNYLKNELASFLQLNSEVDITLQKTSNAIHNSEGVFLFSLAFPESFSLSQSQTFLVVAVYLIIYILIIALIYKAYKSFLPGSNFKLVRLLGFVADLVILRSVTFFFRYPKEVFDTAFFSPEYYASSVWIPSLGDLFMNVLTFFTIALAIYRSLIGHINYRNVAGYKLMLISIPVMIYVFGLFTLMIRIIESLVFNSGISFNLNDLSGINHYSIIGFIAIGLIITSFIFLTFPVNRRLFILLNRQKLFVLLVLILFSFLLYFFTKASNCSPVTFLFLLAYFLFFLLDYNLKDHTFSIPNVLLLILLFSVFTTYLLFQSNVKREQEIREILASNLTEQRDPIAEFKFSENQTAIKNDSILTNLLGNYPFSELSDLEKTTDYLSRTYFSNFWSKYDVLITICDTGRILNIRPDDFLVNCHMFFEDIIKSNGKGTNSTNLFFIDLEQNDDYYLGIIPIEANEGPLSIYIEFYSRSAPKGLGYPELLKDSNKDKEINWSVYSYARYENNELFFRLGKYFYSMDLENYAFNLKSPQFFDLNGYNHYYYPINDTSALIISIQNPGLLEITAPFSYISIFYGLLVYLIFLILKGHVHFKLNNLGFKQRIQLLITLLILGSFIIVGVSSSFFIINLNNKKNNAILSEKAHSVLVELEHKLSGEEELPMDMEVYLSNLLYKFSIVFFTDINLYDLSGTLLATSRAEIFNKGLVSTKMNSEAFLNLSITKKSLYIHDEAIGDYPFLSAYLPLRNYNNDLIAYINLPYFAKQDELTNEISDFLLAFVNIYVILIAISIYMALFVSNYISKPLQLLKEKLRTLKLGEAQQKIIWQKNDEIGSLVDEYNRMVDELEKSAELLAKSERESAWREMAKQIAHEIKNPLTPMKLSVQYLEKAWNDKSPDWEERLKRFSQTLIEQIESLSIIATAFSDFANMPKSKFAKIELSEIANSAIALFSANSPVKFELQTGSKHYISGDKEQFLRVFNNLFKNSLQAIKNEETGIIKVQIETSDLHETIKVYDNGHGIADDEKEKVFYPNFTTKTGGTGLGLALVKNIIVNAGGDITFESSPAGTTFTIILPKYNGLKNEEEN